MFLSISHSLFDSKSSLTKDKNVNILLLTSCVHAYCLNMDLTRIVAKICSKDIVLPKI